jgi:hypothetical protein
VEYSEFVVRWLLLLTLECASSALMSQWQEVHLRLPRFPMLSHAGVYYEETALY